MLGKSLWNLKCTGNLATVSATCIVLVLKQDSDPGKVTLSDYESDLGFVLWDNWWTTCEQSIQSLTWNKRTTGCTPSHLFTGTGTGDTFHTNIQH